MTDIVERLLDSEQPDVRVWRIRGKDAAVEIERLRAENVRLQEALIFDPKEMSDEIER